MKAGIFALATIIICLPASAQQFWNGTKYGMSVQEVKALVGPSIKEDPDTPRPPRFRLLTDYSFCGSSFEIVFIFTDDKLQREALNFTGDAGNVASCVVQEFTKAYGRPVLNDQSRNSFGDNVHIVFTRDSTVVDVSIRLSGKFVTILYEVKDSKL